jgi:hypothetical protein
MVHDLDILEHTRHACPKGFNVGVWGWKLDLLQRNQLVRAGAELALENFVRCTFSEALVLIKFRFYVLFETERLDDGEKALEGADLVHGRLGEAADARH